MISRVLLIVLGCGVKEALVNIIVVGRGVKGALVNLIVVIPKDAVAFTMFDRR